MSASAAASVAVGGLDPLASSQVNTILPLPNYDCIVHSSHGANPTSPFPTAAISKSPLPTSHHAATSNFGGGGSPSHRQPLHPSQPSTSLIVDPNSSVADPITANAVTFDSADPNKANRVVLHPGRHLSGCLQTDLNFGKCPPPVCGSYSELSTCPPSVCVMSLAAVMSTVAPSFNAGLPPCSEKVVQQVKPCPQPPLHLSPSRPPPSCPSSTSPTNATDSNLGAVTCGCVQSTPSVQYPVAVTNFPAPCSGLAGGNIQAPAFCNSIQQAVAGLDTTNITDGAEFSGCLSSVLPCVKCPPSVCANYSGISTCPPTVCKLSNTPILLDEFSGLSCTASLQNSVIEKAFQQAPAVTPLLEGGTKSAPSKDGLVTATQSLPQPLSYAPTKSSTQPLSYAHVASQAVAPALDQKGFYNNHAPVNGECVIKQPTLHQGKPAVLFKVSEKQQLIGNMKHVLVGKFSHGRPPINVIREFFVKLNLKGEYNLSLFDTRHLFIECSLLEDFTRLWVRLTWPIQRFAMRLFRWTPDFTPEHESPLCPVWIHLPRLPLYMFQESCLLSVANTIGRPLSLDSNNVKRIKLGEARVCVELDASQPLVHETWVGFEEDTGKDGQPPKVIDGFWQHVVYDDCPAYCLECYHLGHASSACKRGKGKGKAVVQDKIQVEDLGATSSSKNDETIQEKVQHEEERFRQRKQNGSTKRGPWQQKNTGGLNVAKSEGAKVQAIQNKYSVPTQNKYVDLDKVDDLSAVCLPHTVSSAPPSPKVPPSDDLNEVGVSEKRPSWADLAEEDITIISKLTLSGAKEYAIKQIEKIMNSDDEGCKTPVTVQDKSETVAEHAEGNEDDYPAKSSSKSFSTDLPDLDLDPPIDSSPGGEATKMSTLLANNHLLVARRSVSPKGRSSQKLRSLRHKVDTLDFSNDKADVVDREVYSELGHELRSGVAYKTSY